MWIVNGSDYAYVLGLYLGDGCITDTGRAYTMVITLDSAYPGLIVDCAEALARVSPRRAAIHKHPVHNFVRVTSSWKLWPVLFPQHGPGRKHERPIVLTTWQWELVRLHREAFIRGLIHSDGCRTVNRFTTKLPSGRVAEYEYVRYFFSNLSAEIRQLFREVCHELGIRTTQSNHRNISISHRDSVAVLERIVGPKS